MRVLRSGLVILGATLFLGCGASREAMPAENDPAITAALDSLLTVAMNGAAEANAGKVLSIAEGAHNLTFVSGDALLSGLDSIRAGFEKTYAGVKHQDQRIIAKRVRVLSPDVALVMATAEGTYTDTAGVVSQPVGLGLTIVFVRHDGRWVAEHAHQSFIY